MFNHIKKVKINSLRHNKLLIILDTLNHVNVHFKNEKRVKRILTKIDLIQQEVFKEIIN